VKENGRKKGHWSIRRPIAVACGSSFRSMYLLSLLEDTNQANKTGAVDQLTAGELKLCVRMVYNSLRLLNEQSSSYQCSY